MRRIDDMRSQEEGPTTGAHEEAFASEPHVVQLYRTPTVLHRSVASWTSLALASGGGALLIGTPAHTTRIRERLREEGMDPSGLEQGGRLVALDAATLLRELVVDGRIRQEVLSDRVGDLVCRIRRACGSDRADVRAWGEMVDLLAGRGELRLAADLERAWNAVILRERVRLLCSYEVARLGSRAYASLLRDVQASHGWIACEGHHVLTPGDDAAGRAPCAKAHGAPLIPPALAEGASHLTTG